MKAFIIAGGLVASASYSAQASAAPLVFAGVDAHSDVRRTRALSCLNYFGNQDYGCRYGLPNYAEVPVHNSFVSYNRKTFRPRWLRLTLKPTNPQKLLLSLIRDYGLPRGQGELTVKGLSAGRKGTYTIWEFDRDATIIVKSVPDAMQLEVRFPENAEP